MNARARHQTHKRKEKVLDYVFTVKYVHPGGCGIDGKVIIWLELFILLIRLLGSLVPFSRSCIRRIEVACLQC